MQSQSLSKRFKDIKHAFYSTKSDKKANTLNEQIRNVY